MFRILLIVIGLIVYGSLWPWQYNPAHAPGNPFSILFHSWPGKGVKFDVEDIVVNLLLYLPVGMFGYLAFQKRAYRTMRFAGPIVLGFALSAFIEMTQIFDRTRTCSAVDLLCNTISAALGVLLGLIFRESLLASLRRPAAAHNLHASGPLVLAYIWVGYQIVPLFPITFHVLPKIKALLSQHFSTVELLASFTAWLVAARLLQAIYDASLSWRLLLLLTLLAPVKILIASRTPSLPELCGVAAALIVWKAVLHRMVSRTAILAGLAISLLLIQGLRPFHFTAHNHFSWIPFLALLLSPWDSGLVTLCQKGFWYGASIWLLWASGRRLIVSIVSVAALLAAIEAAQIYLPGRTAEITDPLLAILMGAILWLLEIHGRRGAMLPVGQALAQCHIVFDRPV